MFSSSVSYSAVNESLKKLKSSCISGVLCCFLFLMLLRIFQYSFGFLLCRLRSLCSVFLLNLRIYLFIVFFVLFAGLV